MQYGPIIQYTLTCQPCDNSVTFLWWYCDHIVYVVVVYNMVDDKFILSECRWIFSMGFGTNRIQQVSADAPPPATSEAADACMECMWRFIRFWGDSIQRHYVTWHVQWTTIDHGCMYTGTLRMQFLSNYLAVMGHAHLHTRYILLQVKCNVL